MVCIKSTDDLHIRSPIANGNNKIWQSILANYNMHGIEGTTHGPSCTHETYLIIRVSWLLALKSDPRA